MDSSLEEIDFHSFNYLLRKLETLWSTLETRKLANDFNIELIYKKIISYLYNENRLKLINYSTSNFNDQEIHQEVKQKQQEQQEQKVPQEQQEQQEQKEPQEQQEQQEQKEPQEQQEQQEQKEPQEQQEQLEQQESPNDDIIEIYKIIKLAMNILVIQTDKSASFRIKFHEAGGTKVILQYLNDDHFVAACKKLKDKNCNEGMILLSYATATCFNLTKLIDKTKEVSKKN
jgi:flagellar biosynthesis GTPase FlhF